MNKISINIDIYIMLLFLDLFCILSFIYFNFGQNTLINFIMLGIIFLTLTISYFKGLLWGLITSSIIIFLYASYILYNNISYGKTVELNTYVWMIGIPISTFITGRLSYHINSLQTINKNLQEKYKTLITIDETTGLGNIRGFYNDLGREMSKSQRHKNPLTLMIIKINYYNNLHHLLGKTKMKDILKNISSSINSFTRNEDIRYKLDKDKFAVLMPQTNIKGAKIVKERIKKGLKDADLKEEKNNQTIDLDIKIGILEYNKDIKNSFEFKELTERELEYDV